MSRARGRPPTFTRDDLVAAALRLGPDRITMQALADELGVARTSLYWHVSDQAEVGEIVLAGIYGRECDLEWSPPAGASWDERLAARVRAQRGWMMSAGRWLQYSTPRLFYTPESLQQIECMLSDLRSVGFTSEDATFTVGFMFELLFVNTRSTEDAPVGELSDALADELDNYEPDELTHLRNLVAVGRRSSADLRFEFALDCALRGIADRVGVERG